jgi:protein SCO1/2
MSQPVEKADFTLNDTDGQPFHFVEQTEGYVALVFFGYTYCPDVCPIHMANIAAVLRDFPYDLQQQFKVIFITTDPERDTPDRMREWLDAFDSSFIGLRGTVDEVNEIAASMWLPPAIRVDNESGGYEVGHSANVVAFTKDNRAHVRYPFGTRQSDWAHDLPKLAVETWGTE